MKTRSLLSQYIQILRRRRGYSIDYVAEKTSMGLADYVYCEENPEKIPLDLWAWIFNCLNLTQDEFVDFQLVALFVTQKPGDSSFFSKEQKSTEQNFSLNENVLSLFGQRQLGIDESEQGIDDERNDAN